MFCPKVVVISYHRDPVGHRTCDYEYPKLNNYIFIDINVIFNRNYQVSLSFNDEIKR